MLNAASFELSASSMNTMMLGIDNLVFTKMCVAKSHNEGSVLQIFNIV